MSLWLLQVLGLVAKWLFPRIKSYTLMIFFGELVSCILMELHSVCWDVTCKPSNQLAYWIFSEDRGQSSESVSRSQTIFCFILLRDFSSCFPVSPEETGELLIRKHFDLRLNSTSQTAASTKETEASPQVVLQTEEI